MRSSDVRCASCHGRIIADDREVWDYRELENSSHLLHGLVHTNGFGHLLTVNGHGGGSKFLAGYDIMSFWDRLCKMLRVRKISVVDVSKKYGMEYRLLHTILEGHSWFGDWGYEFGVGSFSITAETYQNAVDSLPNIQLSSLSYHQPWQTQFQEIIAIYRFISDRQIKTLRDLFQVMIQLVRKNYKKRNGKEAMRKSIANAETTIPCSWENEKVEQSVTAIIRVLKSFQTPQWVTWHRLWRATCSSVASPELLNYCLKILKAKNNVHGKIVASRYNDNKKCLECRLEGPSGPTLSDRSTCMPQRQQILNHLSLLQDIIVVPKAEHPAKHIGNSAVNQVQIIIDCKKFIKIYDKCSYDTIQIWCHVQLADQQNVKATPPPELLMLPLETTVADLKVEVTKIFQDIYPYFETFQAEQILDFEGITDSTQIQLLIGSKGTLHIKGKCARSNQRLIRFQMERGGDKWEVQCSCGTKDDDGERMWACDTCSIWQHTRCCGIADSEEVPIEFICNVCKNSA